jgi:hypothetical protein
MGPIGRARRGFREEVGVEREYEVRDDNARRVRFATVEGHRVESAKTRSDVRRRPSLTRSPPRRRVEPGAGEWSGSAQIELVTR